MLDLDVRASPRCSESLFLTLLVRNLIGSSRIATRLSWRWHSRGADPRGRKKMIKHRKNVEKTSGKVTLKAVAERVGLAAGTVSSILNRAPQASSLPRGTKDRVFAAARELNYQPNLLARALRMGKTPSARANGRELGGESG